MNRLHIWHPKTQFFDKAHTDSEHATYLQSYGRHATDLKHSITLRIQNATFQLLSKSYARNCILDIYFLKSAPIRSSYRHLALNSSPLVTSSITKTANQSIEQFSPLQSCILMLLDSDVGTGPSKCILSPKRPIYPHLDHLYQEIVVLHRRNKLQGLSTHRHNARHTLSACIVTMSHIRKSGKI